MEIKFARSESVADVIMSLMHETSSSIEGALFRFNHPGLADALEDVAQRGVRVRLLVDGNKYKESRTTQELLSGAIIPFRLAFGRQGRGTHESEEENQENLLILRDEYSVEAYSQEFEALWAGAARDDSKESW